MLNNPKRRFLARAVSGEQPIPFGGTSVLATARRGDRLSFYEWPSQDMIMPRLKASAEGGARVEHLQALVAAPALAAAASALEKSLIGVWPAPGGELIHHHQYIQLIVY